MPCVSDPGYELINLARKNFIKIEIIPGPCAISSAIALSGLDVREFIFYGFINLNNKHERKKIIQEAKFANKLIILYEAPHRIIKLIKFLFENLGDRQVILLKELTKIHENYLSGNLSEILIILQQENIKGEFVVLLCANKNNKKFDWHELSLEEHINFYLKLDLDLKSAVKQVSHDRKICKNQVYKITHE